MLVGSCSSAQISTDPGLVLLVCDLGFFVKMNGSGAPYQQSDPLARLRRWLTEALHAGHFRRTIRQGAVAWHQYGRLWSFNCYNTVTTQTDPTVFRPDDQVLACQEKYKHDQPTGDNNITECSPQTSQLCWKHRCSRHISGHNVSYITMIDLTDHL